MRRALQVMAAAALVVVGRPLWADDGLPPWADPNDIPMPPWTRSVSPTKAESAIYAEPGRIELRRGSAQPGARLPLFASRRGPSCLGRWLNVGPLAWMCSDVADYTADDPSTPPLGSRVWSLTSDGDDELRPHRPGAHPLPPIEPASPTDDGLPFRYYVAGPDGAYGYASLATALEDAPDQELEAGFAVAIVEEQTAHGERWGKTKKGRWIAMRELSPTRPNLFHGERVPSEREGLTVAWVVADRAPVFAPASANPKAALSKPAGMRVRFERLEVYEERAESKTSTMVRVSPDGAPAAWMRAKDLARPKLVDPPPEVTGVAERWIDVDLGQQALVAYEGRRPVFVTLVSTGIGKSPPRKKEGDAPPAPDVDFSTHAGTFRIWVKVFTTKMDNLDKEDVDRHYALEDVPWVQFFDKAIALHGAFWHKDFGRVHSHGCVNLSPIDARWLFAFTTPHLPLGWTAVLPTKIEQGAVVRVR